MVIHMPPLCRYVAITRHQDEHLETEQFSGIEGDITKWYVPEHAPDMHSYG